MILASLHIFKKSVKTSTKASSEFAPPKKSSAKFAMFGNDLGFSMLCSALVYAFCAMVAAFLVPMTNRLNWKRPSGVQNAVISRAFALNKTDQYCFSPSAENLYLVLATL